MALVYFPGGGPPSTIMAVTLTHSDGVPAQGMQGVQGTGGTEGTEGVQGAQSTGAKFLSRAP